MDPRERVQRIACALWHVREAQVAVLTNRGRTVAIVEWPCGAEPWLRSDYRAAQANDATEDAALARLATEMLLGAREEARQLRAEAATLSDRADALSRRATALDAAVSKLIAEGV